MAATAIWDRSSPAWWKKMRNAEIIAGIDMNDNGQNDYPVFKSLAECDVPADVVVDFSTSKATDTLLDTVQE